MINMFIILTPACMVRSIQTHHRKFRRRRKQFQRNLQFHGTVLKFTLQFTLEYWLFKHVLDVGNLNTVLKVLISICLDINLPWFRFAMISICLDFDLFWFLFALISICLSDFDLSWFQFCLYFYWPWFQFAFISIGLDSNLPSFLLVLISICLSGFDLPWFQFALISICLDFYWP